MSEAWAVGASLLSIDGVTAAARDAAAAVVALELRFGLRRSVSLGLSVLEVYVPRGPLPTEPAPWFAALRARYPDALRRVPLSTLQVSSVSPAAAEARLRAKVLPAPRFGEFLDGDDFEPTPEGTAASAERDAQLATLLQETLVPLAADAAVWCIDAFDRIHGKGEHELTVLAHGSVVLVAVRSYAL